MTCCCGRPAGGKVIGPTAGRALRRYLSDKQGPPPSRGAEHVAECGPELLTPNGSGGPRLCEPEYRTGGMAWRAGAFRAPGISTAEWIRPFLRMTDHLQTQIVVLEAAPTWATSWRQEDNHQYVCSGKCV